MRQKRPPRIKGKKTNAGQRSMNYLRKLGYTVDKAEHYVSRPQGAGQAAKFAGGYRKDLFGFMDLIAYGENDVFAVQTTSRQQMMAHLRKYRSDPTLADRIRLWISSPGRSFYIHGWECNEVPTKAGGTKAMWNLTERMITAGDLIDPAF
jgi:hypothetical protein